LLAFAAEQVIARLLRGEHALLGRGGNGLRASYAALDEPLLERSRHEVAVMQVDVRSEARAASSFLHRGFLIDQGSTWHGARKETRTRDAMDVNLILTIISTMTGIIASRRKLRSFFLCNRTRRS
jgi:hypothetical protein